LPIDHRVTFKTVLTKNNLVSIPKIVRWQYKLEPSEVLKVTVSVVGLMGVRESFLARMYKDGRLLIPKLILVLLRQNAQNLEEYPLEVTLEPA
jgi:hypothetical protein